MEIQEILTLIKAVSDSKLTHFKYEENGVKLMLKEERSPKIAASKIEAAQAISPSSVLIQAPQTAMPQNSISESIEESIKEGEMITSPMVGTFYRASSEEAEPFVTVGEHVKKGQVVGIVEAMKLMNEIESPFDGIVEEILVENKEMVGFGQDLIRIKV